MERSRRERLGSASPSDRPHPFNDPISTALEWLNDPVRCDALLSALERRIAGEMDERRHFAAAAGRVYNLSGRPALVQAVRNYLFSLRQSVDAGHGRAAMVTFLAEMVDEPRSRSDAETLWAALTSNAAPPLTTPA